MSSDSEDEMLAICGAACAAAALLVVDDEVSGMPCFLLSYLDDDVETLHSILDKEVELTNVCCFLVTTTTAIGY